MGIGIFALLLQNFLGGALSPIFVKTGVEQISPLVFTMFRFLIAAAVFLPFFLILKKKPDKRGIREISLFSVFFTLNATLYAIGLKYTAIIVSQIFYTTVPVFVAVFAFIFLKEKITRNKILGGLVAGAGVIFLMLQSIERNEAQTFGTPLGNAIVMTAVVSWALYITFSKKLTNKYDPVATTFISFAVTIILLAFVLPFDRFFFEPRPFVLSDSLIVSLLGVGVISSALIFFLFQFGVKRTSAFTSSLFFYFAPFFASLTAIPLEGEKITGNLVIGGLLIIFGVFYATSFDVILRKLKRKST